MRNARGETGNVEKRQSAWGKEPEATNRDKATTSNRKELLQNSDKNNLDKKF